MKENLVESAIKETLIPGKRLMRDLIKILKMEIAWKIASAPPRSLSNISQHVREIISKFLKSD